MPSNLLDEAEQRLPRRYQQSGSDVFALVKAFVADSGLSQPSLLVLPGSAAAAVETAMQDLALGNVPRPLITTEYLNPIWSHWIQTECNFSVTLVTKEQATIWMRNVKPLWWNLLRLWSLNTLSMAELAGICRLWGGKSPEVLRICLGSNLSWLGEHLPCKEGCPIWSIQGHILFIAWLWNFTDTTRAQKKKWIWDWQSFVGNCCDNIIQSTELIIENNNLKLIESCKTLSWVEDPIQNPAQDLWPSA